MKNGFVTLFGLLLVVLTIGILFVRTYSTSGTDKSKIEIYNESIKDAENIKRTLENRNSN